MAARAGKQLTPSCADLDGDVLHASIGLPPTLRVTEARVGMMELKVRKRVAEIFTLEEKHILYHIWHVWNIARSFVSKVHCYMSRNSIHWSDER